MNWIELTRDTRPERCTHKECTNQPTWQLEQDGVKSLYCTKHKEKIEAASEVLYRRVESGDGHVRYEPVVRP